MFLKDSYDTDLHLITISSLYSTYISRCNNVVTEIATQIGTIDTYESVRRFLRMI